MIARSTSETAVGDHLVGLYEDELHLRDTVTTFLAAGLQAGDAGVLVATPAHREAFVAGLREAGLDVDTAMTVGRLQLIDADELMARFFVDGELEPTACRSVLGELLDRAADVGGSVRVFGEMVALLWERGDVGGALALERIWNGLAHHHPFALLCAYALHTFDTTEASDPFRQMLAQHTHVLPSEPLSRTDDPDAQARLVALLQQEANAGRSEREQLLEQLREPDRVSDFVSMVVHDIQSPTAVTTALLELLRRGWGDLAPEEVDDYLGTALHSARRVERLAADILTVARIDSGHFTYDLRPLDLRTVVEAAVADVEAITNRRIGVTAHADLQPVRADADRQLQILTNLLTNAVKFSPDDTGVFVTIEQDRERQIVRVRDEGIGIGREEQASLFLPFSRLRNGADRAARGTGLGLHTAKALVEGQGGLLWVESQAGEGSTFSYTVPLATEG